LWSAWLLRQLLLLSSQAGESKQHSQGTELGVVEGTQNVPRIKIVTTKSQSGLYSISTAAYFVQLTVF